MLLLLRPSLSVILFACLSRGSYRFLVSAEWDTALAETRILKCIAWRILELPGYMEDPSHLAQMVNDRYTNECITIIIVIH